MTTKHELAIPKFLKRNGNGKKATPQVAALPGMTPLGMKSVMLATADADAGIVPASKAPSEAQKLANETGKVVSLRHPTSDKVLAKVAPSKKVKKVAKQAKPSKGKPAAKLVKAATKVAKPAEGYKPEGKTAECVRLALRPKGVSPAELIELTGWTKAPWKWWFENPQGTGRAQKLGLQFRVEKSGGETHYHLATK